ncbi:MAG: FYDLN acid domain-containing protein [Kiritimatiellae bacterium]|nr:FYDLN acid domain-containing protein [Kiritimatiellia bacterium]
MTTVPQGKPCAGNPHARFEEGASAQAEPRRGALLYNCPTCGKELYDNGEDLFNCPFCGAEVVSERFAAKETAEEKLRRLERELERQKLNAEIEAQSAFEHFWFRGGNLFSMLDRQSAREALERGDIEMARKYFTKAFKTGCLLHLVLVIVVVLVAVAVFVSRACNGNA